MLTHAARQCLRTRLLTHAARQCLRTRMLTHAARQCLRTRLLTHAARHCLRTRLLTHAARHCFGLAYEKRLLLLLEHPCGEIRRGVRSGPRVVADVLEAGETNVVATSVLDCLNRLLIGFIDAILIATEDPNR